MVGVALAVAVLGTLLDAVLLLPMSEIRNGADKPIQVTFSNTQPPLPTLFSFVVSDRAYWSGKLFGASDLGWTVHYAYLGGGLFAFLLFLVPAFRARPSRDLLLLILGCLLNSGPGLRPAHLHLGSGGSPGRPCSSYASGRRPPTPPPSCSSPCAWPGPTTFGGPWPGPAPGWDSSGPRPVLSVLGGRKKRLLARPASRLEAPLPSPPRPASRLVSPRPAPRPGRRGRLAPGPLPGGPVGSPAGLPLGGVMADPWRVNQALLHVLPRDASLDRTFAWLRDHDGGAYTVLNHEHFQPGFASYGQVVHGVSVLNSTWLFKPRLRPTAGAPDGGRRTPAPRYVIQRPGITPPPGAVRLATVEGGGGPLHPRGSPSPSSPTR